MEWWDYSPKVEKIPSHSLKYILDPDKNQEIRFTLLIMGNFIFV